jgi:hypothetical protein
MVGPHISFMANIGWIDVGEDNGCPLWNHCEIFKTWVDFFFIELFLVNVIYEKW